MRHFGLQSHDDLPPDETANAIILLWKSLGIVVVFAMAVLALIALIWGAI